MERGVAALNRIRSILLAAMALFCALTLSGCIAKTVDELYALPRHSDEYYELQKAIDGVMTEGVQYAAPVSGRNQQSVQLADLDGDGEVEAIVFLRTTGENPLSACIFDLMDGHYELIGTIEGSGAAFESVEYAELDGAAGVEMILGRQLSNQVLQALSVYTLTDGRVVELLSANYSEYTLADLDGDGQKDIFLLRFDPEQRTGVAELYRCVDGQFERAPEASMSAGVEGIKRILTGYLSYDVPAVFVASVYDAESIVTDVFAYRGGVFQNVSATDTGMSVQTVRNYFVYAADIDSDGLIELPQLVTPPSSDPNGEQYSIIRWYNLTMGGAQRIKRTTYHSFSGGWYVTLPDEWAESITVSRSDEVSGVRGLVFSQWNTGTRSAVPIFTVYAFSGEDRSALASSDGRFVIAEKGDTVYAAELGTSPWASELSEETLRKMFNFIHIDWNSGER